MNFEKININSLKFLFLDSVSPPLNRSSSSDNSNHISSQANNSSSNYSPPSQQRLLVRRLDSAEIEAPLEMEDLLQPSSSNNPLENVEAVTSQSPLRRRPQRRQIQSDESETDDFSLEPNVLEEAVLSERQIEEALKVENSYGVLCKKRKIENKYENAPTTSKTSISVIQDIPISCTEKENGIFNEQKKKIKDSEKKWHPIVKSIRFPFIAQIGDTIVYLKQGHQLYIKSVKNQNLFPITSKMLPR